MYVCMYACMYNIIYVCSDVYLLVHVFRVYAQFAGTLHHHDLAQQQLNVHAQIPRVLECDR